MTALDLLKKQIEDVRWTFEHTVEDINEAHLHTDPGGVAFPLGSTYAHVLFSEDMIVQGLLQKKAPLFVTTWKDKTGADKPMPSFDNKDWSEENKKWSKSVKINLEQMKKYQKAIFKATDAYMATLKPKDLDKEVDLGSMGKRTVTALISDFMIGHMYSVTGEISVLKGLQGAKGYPF
jgi:hypothetical protein